LVRFPTLPDSSECLFAIDEFAAISLLAAHSDLPSQFINPQPLQLLSLF
jgi:hypothetical protein